MIFLVRHAKAGHRDPTVSDDTGRPLTNSGWAQSKALVKTLLAAGATGPLLSSRNVRFVQTLEPLATSLGLTVTVDSRLAEAEPFEPLLELIQKTPDGSVLCSHGDMIPDVMEAIERRGCRITTEPNWKKGSVWVLQRDDDGNVVSAACWPPPDS
jgi:phosphohistidine phosphatase SixA